MTRLAAKLRTLRDAEQGATMVEYALIVVLIALVVAVGAAVLGTAISSLFNSIATKL